MNGSDDGGVPGVGAGRPATTPADSDGMPDTAAARAVASARRVTWPGPLSAVWGPGAGVPAASFAPGPSLTAGGTSTTGRSTTTGGTLTTGGRSSGKTLATGGASAA